MTLPHNIAARLRGFKRKQITVLQLKKNKNISGGGKPHKSRQSNITKIKINIVNSLRDPNISGD